MSAPGLFDPGSDFDQWMKLNGPYLICAIGSMISVGFFVRGLGLLQNATRTRRVVQRMPTFPSVTGEVVVAEQRTLSASRGVMYYYPFIQYRYEVQGRTYTDHHILPSEFVPSHGNDWVAQWLAAYPVGRQIEVFYDPRDPRISVVDRQTQAVEQRVRTDTMLGVVLILLCLVALYLLATRVFPLGGGLYLPASDLPEAFPFSQAATGASS